MSDQGSICTEESTWTNAVTPSATETEAGHLDPDPDPTILAFIADVRRELTKMAQSAHEITRPADELKRPRMPSTFSYPAALPGDYLDHALHENYYRHLWFVFREVASSIISLMYTSNVQSRGHRTAHLVLWDVNADRAVLSMSQDVFGKSAENLIYLMYISHSKRGLSGGKVAYYILWDVLAEKAVLSVRHEFTLREDREKISIEDAYGHVMRKMLLELGTRIDQKIQHRSP